MAGPSFPGSMPPGEQQPGCVGWVMPAACPLVTRPCSGDSPAGGGCQLIDGHQDRAGRLAGGHATRGESWSRDGRGSDSLTEAAVPTWWCRPTPMPHPTTWSTTCRMSIRPFARRWPPTGTSRRLAISMFGGVDPGVVDESDPVRAVATRRLAGMGVDTAAATVAGRSTPSTG